MPRVFVILLLALSLRSQTNTALGTPGIVQGRVTDAQTGDGIESAVVQLFARGYANGSTPPHTVSLPGGSFRFDSVPPGTYFLFVRHPGYTVPPNAMQPVSVASGQQVPDLALQMSALGNITGKSLDDAHQPVPGIRVQLFGTYLLRGKTQVRPMQNSTSNERGEFLFKKVIPGRYYLAAEPRSSAEPGKAGEILRTFYPNVTALENAGTVEMPPGASFAGADIQLQHGRTFHVRGKVESLLAGELQAGARLTLAARDAYPSDGLARTARAKPDGTFDIARVASGSYTLWLFGTPASSTGPARGNGRRLRTLARQDLDVEGTDLNGVTLSLLPPVNLTGQVTLLNPPANTNLAQLRLNLVPALPGAPGAYQSLQLGPGGEFSVQDLTPGEYLVRVLNIPSGMYVQSIAFNRQDVAQSGLDLSQGGGGELDITLRTGTGEVAGNLAGQVSSAIVLLVPEVPADDASGILSGTIKPGGTFLISNVPPGRYSAFAIGNMSSLWQNADFLRAMQREGKSLSLEENAHAQIQLPLSSEEQIQNTAARLGLSAQ